VCIKVFPKEKNFLEEWAVMVYGKEHYKSSSFFTDNKIKITQKLIKKYAKRVSKIFIKKTISTTLFNSSR
jgi:hypothetical protein